MYAARGAEGVSWYEPSAEVSLELVEELGVDAAEPVVDVGGGASTFAVELAGRGFRDVTVLDLSEEALTAARRRASGAAIEWLHADVLTWRPERPFGLWHDRALFHFLVDPHDRAAYVERLHAALRPGGAVVVATFAPEAPDRCSGLPVVRYSAPELAAALGPGLELQAVRREEHRTPGGAVQPFTWVAGRLAQRGQ